MGFSKLLSFGINYFMTQEIRSRTLYNDLFHHGSVLEGNHPWARKWTFRLTRKTSLLLHTNKQGAKSCNNRFGGARFKGGGQSLSFSRLSFTHVKMRIMIPVLTPSLL